ncbi:arylsulfatase [Gaetbulibacter aquiaggeris]|uniref:Arylsulfatase n=1 Tax=Gaetbulibacter aquiaggeris TaxID=1735373 RepID=A0ABW7MP61_9FLAO
MNGRYLIILIAAIISTACSENKKDISNQINKPNIIYILADDLGYGDLSCYGQTKFSTPHIDALAKEGLLFTQHYAGSSVCAPSRSTLLTGLHTGHTPIRGNKEVRPEGQWPLPDSTHTLAELLKDEGYVTGAFGKWGLGYPNSEGDPLNQGFDTFYGYNCQRLAHNYYPYHLWDNDKKVILDGNSGTNKEQYAPELIHNKAMQFIDKNKDRPFFLYYPSIIPHAELFAPNDYMNRFLGKFNPEKKFKGVDEGENYKNGGYGSQENGHAAFAALISLLDDQVGELVAKIKELGLEGNTIFIFTSDNGPHKEAGADPKYFNSNGNLRGFKRDLYEGGIRVPMIVKWKGKVKEGTTTDHISAFWDVFPSFAELIGANLKNNTDGVSFLPILLGEPDKQKTQEYLYWEFNENNAPVQAIRKGDWKAVKFLDKPLQLYNLSTDLKEEHDVSEENSKIKNDMLHILKNAREDSPDFPFKYKQE